MRTLLLALTVSVAYSDWEGDSCKAETGVDGRDSDDVGLLQGTARRQSALQEESQDSPDFGPNVIILEPGMVREENRQRFKEMYEMWVTWDEEGQFGDHRTAVFMKPGLHKIDLDLPYYVQVLGLGAKPTETVAEPGVDGIGLRVGQQPGNKPNTNTFWRSIENVEIPQNLDFFVSQAAPLRKVKVHGNLALSGGGNDYTSGGALANSEIGGEIFTNTQQQWYTRGTKMRPYDHPAGIGSYAAIGCVTPEGDPFNPSYDFRKGYHKPWQTDHSGLTYTEAPLVFAEKPFIMFQEGEYKLRIPQVLENHAGPDWQTGSTVGFNKVLLAKPNTTAREINTAIKKGLHVILTPGVYHLEEPIVIDVPDIVILGLGFATLVPKTTEAFVGRGVIEVGAVDGVRLASIFLQAGALDEPDYSKAVKALVRWGDPERPYEGKRSNPGFMYDFVARVGGPDHAPAGVDTMLEINNGWVITDNTWLWKADHCVENSGALCIHQRYVNHCLVVNGANVHMYGLMAEHSNEDIVVWNGEWGKTYFFQSEFKYTMGLQSKPKTWQNVSHSVSYRVNAENHVALAMGIYCVVLADEVDDDKVPMANVNQQGGLSAIAVKHPDTYIWGFKDIGALNWNMNWPQNSKLTCKAWDGEGQLCLDHRVTPPR